MTTLDQIIAETAEYARLKAGATDGEWRRVDYDDDYDGTLRHYVSMREDEKWANTVDSTMLKKCDADFIVAAHNMPIEQYITLLVNRVKRLEDALNEARPVEHHEQCRIYGSTGVCECDYAPGNAAIDLVLNEGLK